jgi:hypothetical protein
MRTLALLPLALTLTGCASVLSSQPEDFNLNSAPSAFAPPPPSKGQHSRRGFWLNGGLGYGSHGCDDCDGRQGAPSGGLGLGGTLSQKVLLGVGTTGWYKKEDGVTLHVGTLAAITRFYPSATGGFFLLGGLGVGGIHTEVEGFGSVNDRGFGAVVGLGYDARIGRNVSITPFWNGFAIRASDADANVAQIGLGLTLH